jgi:hypothetical protein
MTICNKNQNLYFNNGFLLLRNCTNTEQTISRVIEIGATQSDPSHQVTRTYSERFPVRRYMGFAM